MKKILAVLGGIIAFLAGLFIRNKVQLNEKLDKQDEELKTSEAKLEELRTEVEKAVIAAEELNKPVSDLTDEEVEEFWKKKLQ